MNEQRIRSAIGDAIREEREFAGLTQAALADRMKASSLESEIAD